MITDFTTAFQIGQTLYIENLGSIPKVLDAMSTLVDPDTISKVTELLQAIVHEDKPEHGDDPNEPWYRLRESDEYWPAYLQLLHSKGSSWSKAANKISTETLDLVNLLPNPIIENFSSYGLVIGDVQSGKTGNFTGLIARAVDSGYNFVIVLSGLYNALRNQTQNRLDAELTGIGHKGVDYFVDPPSRPFLRLTKHGEEFDGSVNINKIRNLENPILAVIKKNSSPLSKIRTILKQLSDSELEKIKLLIIDDEADYATINTSSEFPDSTSTNSHIRSILNLCKSSAYVGYTATPYANLFIEKESDCFSYEFENGGLEDLGLTLHPRNFIYRLNTPDEYNGLSSYFTEETNLDSFEIIDEEERKVWLNYLKTCDFHDSPNSFLSSLIDFITILCLNKLADRKPDYVSMMVNITEKTGDMLPVAKLVREICTAIEISHGEEGHNIVDKIRSLALQRWKNIHSRHFPQFEFNEIWAQFGSVSQIEIVILNDDSKKNISEGFSTEIDLELLKEKPYIVVGGNLLSRGLTIEGLTISYFLRDPDAYDSLMQMGRWFGFNKSNPKMKKVFLTQTTLKKFQDLIEINFDVEQEVLSYHSSALLPTDYSVRVIKSSFKQFLPTAEDKMNSAQYHESQKRLDGFCNLTELFLPQRGDGDNFMKLLTSFDWDSVYGNFRIKQLNSQTIVELFRENLSKLDFSNFQKTFDEIVYNHINNRTWDIIIHNNPAGNMISKHGVDLGVFPKDDTDFFDGIPIGHFFIQENLDVVDCDDKVAEFTSYNSQSAKLNPVLHVFVGKSNFGEIQLIVHIVGKTVTYSIDEHDYYRLVNTNGSGRY